MNYGSLLTNAYTRKKVGHITQNQSRLCHTNDVILTNQRVFTIMTLIKCGRIKIWAQKPRIPNFPSTPSSFKPALVVGGLLKLCKFDIVRTDRRYVKKTGAEIFPVKNNEITRKHLILCTSISDKWQKTHVGKEGVLGGVNRCRNAGKSAKT